MPRACVILLTLKHIVSQRDLYANNRWLRLSLPLTSWRGSPTIIQMSPASISTSGWSFCQILTSSRLQAAKFQSPHPPLLGFVAVFTITFALHYISSTRSCFEDAISIKEIVDFPLTSVDSRVSLRLYYNVCAFGYTTAFWKWPRSRYSTLGNDMGTCGWEGSHSRALGIYCLFRERFSR